MKTLAPIPPAAAALTERTHLARLLTPLDVLAEQSAQVASSPLLGDGADGRPFALPRYCFLGPRGDGAAQPAKVGIFAGIHGDELEGTLALWRCFAQLDRDPSAAAGLVIHGYPVCNPTGLERASRASASGRDLDQEFWRNSAEPEVRLLEAELRAQSYDGIISLHSQRGATGCYGLVDGRLLSGQLLEAALDAASEFLPILRLRNGERRFISPGMLQAPPEGPAPASELALVTPRQAPIHLQVEAVAAALRALMAACSTIYAPSTRLKPVSRPPRAPARHSPHRLSEVPAAVQILCHSTLAASSARMRRSIGPFTLHSTQL